MTAIAELQVALVSGMSGAGRSTAARVLEDLGWYVVDNLPPRLLPATIEHVADATDVRRVAVVTDVRSGELFNELERAVDLVLEEGLDVRVLFLEAGDNELVRRFENNRRPHPLQGSGTLLDGLARERTMLADLRARSDLVIDTTDLNVHQLRAKVTAAFDDHGSIQLRATVMSFGFKYGIPIDADFVADVRFLPNPYWVPELRALTGLDADVHDYVTADPHARTFLDRFSAVLDLAADGYLREGKRYVTVAVGCTGGKHRSVALVENLAVRLVKHGVETLVVHRDLGRE